MRTFGHTVASLLSAVVLASTLAGCAAEHAAPSDDASSAVDGLGEASAITFGADWSAHANGALVAGRKVDVAYDLSRLGACRGEQGGIPQWSVTGYYRIGGGQVQSLALGGLNGTTGALTGVAHATLTLEKPGDLEMWFENVNKWGCHAYDSAYGANYHFTVGTNPAAPGWVGNASVAIARATCDGGPCAADLHPLDGGFSFDTWARQRAAISSAYFQVWKAGVTDFDNPDLWKQLDVQLHARFDESAPFASSYVSFDRRVGNDARYAIPLRSIDPFRGPSGFGGVVVTNKADCPAVPLRVSQDGMYVETDVFFYVTMNGTELRPAAGKSFKGTFSDYKGSYAVCLLPTIGALTYRCRCTRSACRPRWRSS